MFDRLRNSPASAVTPTNVPPARKPRSQRQRQRAQGKSLLEALQAAGIHASDVSRNRRTGIHTVRFVAPNLTAMDSPGTAPAKVWARRITAAFSDVEIVDTYDSVAEWREGQPVIFATVFVKIIGEEKSA